MPHVTWLQDRLKDGSLLASGPLNDTAIKSALLIMTAPNLASLKGIVAGDPFATEGLIENMTMREWDPIFGIFNEQSSMSGKMQSD